MCVIQTALVFQSLPDNMEMLMPSHRDAERTGDEECYHGTDGFMKEAHTHSTCILSDPVVHTQNEIHTNKHSSHTHTHTGIGCSTQTAGVGADV